MNKFLKGDYIIVASIFLIACSILYYFATIQTDEKFVVITKSGEEIYKENISKEHEVEINGQYTNIITIKENGAYFSHANCPDKVCVNTGEVHMVGTSAVCLPNEVVVKIVGEESEVDIVAH